MRALHSSLVLSLLFVSACATTQETKKEDTAEVAPPAVSHGTAHPEPAPIGAPEPNPTTPIGPNLPSVLPPRPLQQPGPMHIVALADVNKPIVTFRLVFRAGSVDDPKGKEGLTALTAELMSTGGTKELSSSQLLEVLFPMASDVTAVTDKELTAFVGRTHTDNLDRYLDIFGDMLLEPRFDPKEFERIRSDFVNNIKNQLRGQDDETLGKVALDQLLYDGTPYAHFVGGTVQGLQSITLEDVKAHWKNVFTQDRLVIGLAGPVDDALQKRILDRLSALPEKGAPRVELPQVQVHSKKAWILPKPVLSTAISMGYAYPLRRGDPDFFPLSLALSYLGEHRQFNGVLFNELREKRGLNYGNYAYAEHFVQEGWGTFALTNIVRSQQDFSIWIRPVESQNAMFASRGAVYFLDRLIKEGVPQEKFELTRGFLLGYTRLWEQTDPRKLGYAVDEVYYGTPNFLQSYRRALESMTVEQVNAAVRRNLSSDRLNFVYVAPDAEALRKLLAEQPPSPISYPTPKPEPVLAEDKKIIVHPLPIDPKQIEIRKVDDFMER